jgi:hypothetical protein
MSVTRCFRLAALALIVVPSLAFAEGETHKGSPEQQRACRTDAARLCRGIRDDLAIADCLKANTSKLRQQCRQVVERGNQ